MHIYELDSSYYVNHAQRDLVLYLWRVHNEISFKKELC